jgi:phage terminase small subunit
MPALEARELLDSFNTINSSNVKSVAIRAGYSHEEADKLETQLLKSESAK